MKYLLKVTLCLTGTLGMYAAVAQQDTASAGDPAADEPVAYVYVTSNSTNGISPNRIVAFVAMQSGKLTPMSGSPFAANVTGIVLNGRYLFGLDRTQSSQIDSFSMASNGELKQVATTDTQDENTSGCPGVASPILDHTGANLYLSAYVGGLCDGTQYLSYVVENSSGKLVYRGSSDVTEFYNWPLTFTGNNVFVYGAECIDYFSGYLDTFAAYERKSDGMLAKLSATLPKPAPADSDSFFCRSITAADPANHLAVAVQAIDFATGMPAGAPQLATYTADARGDLHTASTYRNMPRTAVGQVVDMSMSPSGKLLAVAGTAGLQVFHFNGADAIKPYTGLLMKDPVLLSDPSAGVMFWDNDNHLYVVSPGTDRLFVFTVTEQKVSQAPESPHSIQDPANLAVLPRTR